MYYNLSNIRDVSVPKDLQRLKSVISEIADALDTIVTTTAPNGNISARQGRLALYNNSGTYEVWINTDGATAWQRTDKSQSGVRAYKTSGQTNISSEVDTKVTFDAETFDVNGEFTGSKFTATSAGYYIVSAGILFSTNILADKSYYAQIYKNGVRYAAAVAHASIASEITVTISDIVYLNGTTDYIELYARHNTGADNVGLFESAVIAGNANTWLSIAKL